MKTIGSKPKLATSGSIWTGSNGKGRTIPEKKFSGKVWFKDEYDRIITGELTGIVRKRKGKLFYEIGYTDFYGLTRSMFLESSEIIEGIRV